MKLEYVVVYKHYIHSKNTNVDRIVNRTKRFTDSLDAHEFIKKIKRTTYLTPLVPIEQYAYIKHIILTAEEPTPNGND